MKRANQQDAGGLIRPPVHKLVEPTPVARALLPLLAFALLAVGTLRAEEVVQLELNIPRPGAGFVPWNQKCYAYMQSILGGDFRRTCDQGLPGAPEAGRTLDRLAEILVDLPGAPTWDDLVPQLVALEHFPRWHPVLLEAIGDARNWQPDGQGLALDSYARAFEAYAAGDFRCTQRFLMASHIMSLRSDEDGTVALQAWQREWIASSIALLHDPDLADPVARSIICDLLIRDWTGPVAIARQRTALLAEIAKGGVDPWLAHMVTGRIEMVRAWNVRGASFPVAEVRGDQAAFLDHLARAERAFTAAWTLDTTLGDAACELIGVAMARQQGMGQEVLWFQRALAAQVDYDRAWQAMYTAREPDWGGSNDAIQALGHQAVASGLFATGVPEFLLDALYRLPDEPLAPDPGPRSCWQDAEVLADIVRLFEGYLAEPSRAGLRDWDLTRYAAYLWRCGARTQVRAILARIRTPPSSKLFQHAARMSLERVQQLLAETDR
jgi:hypothetical protein